MNMASQVKKELILKEEPNNLYLKILMAIVALATCTGSFIVYVESRFTTKEIHRVEIKNIKENYEFNIQEIRKDIREIRNKMDKGNSK